MLFFIERMIITLSLKQVERSEMTNLFRVSLVLLQLWEKLFLVVLQTKKNKNQLWCETIQYYDVKQLSI